VSATNQFSISCLPVSLKNLNIQICENIILVVVLYGCETWSLELKDEHRLRVFENRALKRIFGPPGRKWRENGEECK
jgi:hypothetical protein